jgi:tetratricopeptide (TPR) repeat protein
MSDRPDISFETGFYESLHRRLPKETQVIEILGHLYTKQGRITDGLKMDRKMVRLDPDNALAHYNLACSLALKKRKKEAVEALEEAIGLGYRDVDFMVQDDDLGLLKGYPPFDNLISRLKEDQRRAE